MIQYKWQEDKGVQEFYDENQIYNPLTVKTKMIILYQIFILIIPFIKSHFQFEENPTLTPMPYVELLVETLPRYRGWKLAQGYDNGRRPRQRQRVFFLILRKEIRRERGCL